MRPSRNRPRLDQREENPTLEVQVDDLLVIWNDEADDRPSVVNVVTATSVGAALGAAIDGKRGAVLGALVGFGLGATFG